MISLLKSKFSTSSRRALLVSSDKLSVYHWSNNKLGNSYLFDASSEGFEYFGRYLKEVKNDPVYVLVDTAAEEYRLDTIPHVFGSDRKSLIERKQDRAFRGTPYLHADVQEREETGRRDDKVMLSAITNPDVIEPWLEILEAHKIPVASVVSVPLLFQEVKDIIPSMSDNALIFSLQSMSGLRQSFFHDKKLKFSRLVRVPRYGTVSYGPILSEELDKVRRYITSAHLSNPDKPLDIYFLGDHELLGELENNHVNESMIRYHFIDVDTLGAKCGFVDKLRTPFCDKYFIYQLLKSKCGNYYASSKETRYYQMLLLNKTLRVSSIFLILLGIIWGGLGVLEGLAYRQQQRADALKADYYSDRYKIAQERISSLPVAPADLKTIVDSVATIKSYKANPIDMFRVLSNGLDNFPTVEISDMQWDANINPDLLLVSQEGNNLSDTRFGNAMNPIGEESGKEAIYYQIATFNAYIKDFDGDFRKALELIHSFSEFLRNQDSIHDVNIVSLPLDISSTASMQGSAKKSNKDSRFSVRVVLEKNHDS